MDTTQFTSDELTTLATLLTQFRANYDEQDGGDYSNRDELAQKLIRGGDFDETDVYVLDIVIHNEGDEQTWQTFASRLARR